MCLLADMAELADALDLGSSGESRAGSSPVIRILVKKWEIPIFREFPIFFVLKIKCMFWLHLVTLTNFAKPVRF